MGDGGIPVNGGDVRPAAGWLGGALHTQAGAALVQPHLVLYLYLVLPGVVGAEVPDDQGRLARVCSDLDPVHMIKPPAALKPGHSWFRIAEVVGAEVDGFLGRLEGSPCHG